MRRLVRFETKMAEIEESGRRLRRRQDKLKADTAFLGDVLLDRPTADMPSQRRLIIEWEYEIEQLEHSLQSLRNEWARLKEEQYNNHLKREQR